MKWSFGVFENTVVKVFTISLPVVNTFGTPIKFVDEKLNVGLKKIEQKAPIIKEPPTVILQTTKDRALQLADPTVKRVQAVALYTKDKANVVLGTAPAMWALGNFDKVTTGVDHLIDRFIPSKDKEEKKTGKNFLFHSFKPSV